MLIVMKKGKEGDMIGRVRGVTLAGMVWKINSLKKGSLGLRQVNAWERSLQSRENSKRKMFKRRMSFTHLKKRQKAGVTEA